MDRHYKLLIKIYEYFLNGIKLKRENSKLILSTVAHKHQMINNHSEGLMRILEMNFVNEEVFTFDIHSFLDVFCGSEHLITVNQARIGNSCICIHLFDQMSQQTTVSCKFQVQFRTWSIESASIISGPKIKLCLKLKVFIDEEFDLLKEKLISYFHKISLFKPNISLLFECDDNILFRHNSDFEIRTLSEKVDFFIRTHGDNENISVELPKTSSLKFYVCELARWFYIDIAVVFTSKQRLGKHLHVSTFGVFSLLSDTSIKHLSSFIKEIMPQDFSLMNVSTQCCQSSSRNLPYDICLSLCTNEQIHASNLLISFSFKEDYTTDYTHIHNTFLEFMNQNETVLRNILKEAMGFRILKCSSANALAKDESKYRQMVASSISSIIRYSIGSSFKEQCFSLLKASFIKEAEDQILEKLEDCTKHYVNKKK